MGGSLKSRVQALHLRIAKDVDVLSQSLKIMGNKIWKF